jgi:alpha-glucosidase (family GH31 glycosyl hydrolase)
MKAVPLPRTSRFFFTVFAVLLVAAASACGQTWKLESGDLRLDVDGSDGYTYRLVDTSSDQTLLSQSETRLSDSAVTGIDNVSATDKAITGVLKTAGGDHAKVQFTFSRPDVLTVTISGAGDDAPEAIRERFVDNDERYYGVWEHGYEDRNLDNDGLGFDIRNVRESDGWNFSGDDDDIDKVYAASARAPFYMTNTGIAVYAETLARGRYEFDQDDKTGFEFQTPELTYHVITGDYKQILNTYNAIAGPSFRPPDWAYGSIWWRDDHKDVPDYTGASNAQELVLADAKVLRDTRIPATAYWIDRPFTTGKSGFGGDEFHPSDFPDPAAMAQALHDQNLMLMVWIANWKRNDLSEAPHGVGGGIDIREKASYNYFQNYLNKLGDEAHLANGSSGIFGYKIDRGGEGGYPDELQNELVVVFQQMVADQLEKEHGDNYFFFSRSVNDKSRKYTAHWNGDPDCTWQAYEHSVLNAIRSGIINQPMWGSDTGGYKRTPGDELFARWFGFSAYCPMLEVKFDLGREKDFFKKPDAQIVQVARKMCVEHHELIPYVRSLMDENIRTGLAPIRAMFIEFPDDPKTADLPDQYMYGEHMLVAPVVVEGKDSRDVYLPAGEWINYNDRSQRTDSTGQILNVNAPLDEVPVFVRAGAIIPRGDIIQGNNNWTKNWKPWLNIELFVPTSDGENQFDYWTGSDAETISMNKSAEGLKVSFEDLKLNGSLMLYLDKQTQGNLTKGDWKVWLDGKEVADSDYTLKDGVLKVDYNGPTNLVIAEKLP